MIRLGSIALVVLALTACGTPAAPHAGKIAAPVQIAIFATSAPKPGRLADISVTTRALSDNPLVIIRVDLPEDVALFSGDTHWQGPMQRTEVRVMNFTVRVPETDSAVIRAQALAHWEDNVFGAHAQLMLGRRAKPAMPALPPAQGGIRDFPLD